MEKSWYKNYDPGVPHAIDLERYASIPEMLEEAFEKYADNPCFLNFGEILTFKQIDKLSQAYAGFLQHECKLQKGDRVAIMMPNCLQYPVALLGALRAGMVNVNVSPLSSAHEIQSMLEKTDTKCILVLANFAHLLEKALPRTHVRYVVVTQIGDLFPVTKRLLFNFVSTYIKKMVPTWFIANAISFREAISPFYQKNFEKPELCGDDLAYLQFTEGRETGTPKCVMLTHKNFIANGLQCSVWISPQEKDFKGVALLTTPFFKLFALSAHILGMMRYGMANNLITDPRNTALLVKEIERMPVNIISGARPIFNALLFNDRFQKINFSSLKLVFSGGMSASRSIADRWESLTHVPIIEGYALTESSPLAITSPFSTKSFTGMLGLPLPSTDVKICDEQGKEVSLGEYGEIWLQGPQIAKGYWNDPRETAKAFTEDGWFKTGDIGCINEEGYVRFIDRKEDVIKTSKGVVYPSDVENVIAELGGINDVVVVGVLRGEEQSVAIQAYIVKSGDAISEEIIFAHCRRKLSSHQVPEEIKFCDALPKSPLGVVMRNELRKN